MFCFRHALPLHMKSGKGLIYGELKRLGSANVNFSQQISMLSFSGVWEAY